MTPVQIASLIAVAAAAIYFYAPSTSLPTRKPGQMDQIEAVLKIRDTTQSPEVRQACLALLQALLK